MCVGLVVSCPADGIVSSVLLTPRRLVCRLCFVRLWTDRHSIQNDISTARKQPVSLGPFPVQCLLLGETNLADFQSHAMIIPLHSEPSVAIIEIMDGSGPAGTQKTESRQK